MTRLLALVVALTVLAPVDLLAGQRRIRVTPATVAEPGGGDTSPIVAGRLAGGNDSIPNTSWSQYPGVEGGIPARATLCSTAQCNTVTSAGASATGAQINSAIASAVAGTTVKLGSHTYNLSTAITWAGRSDVTLRGNGASLTKLKFTNDITCQGGGFSAPICMPGNDLGYYGPGPPTNSTNWTGTAAGAGVYTQGQTVITLASVTGLSVGRWIVLDQMNDDTDTGNVFVCWEGMADPVQCADEGGEGNARSDRAQRQMVRVSAINGLNVTIDRPIYMPNFRTAQDPEAFWGNSNSLASGNGLEDLSVDADQSGASGAAITMIYTVNSWIKGVRAIYGPSPRAVILIYGGARNTIRDSYIYGTGPTDQGYNTNYGIDSFGNSDLLVENNICHHRTGCWQANGDTGSVWGYNYATDGHYCGMVTADGCPGAQHIFMQGSDYSHEGGNGMVLREGNIGTQIKADVVHATSNLITYHRNYMTGWETGKTEETNAVILYAFQRYYNFTGNVFGRSGYHTAYEARTETSVWNFGESGGVPSGTDLLVATTTMRWCNWDAFTSSADTATNDQTGTKCLSGEVPTGLAYLPNTVPADSTLPSSYYLSAKPPFFAASDTWPGIGKDVTDGDVTGVGGHVFSNPAKECYDGMSDDTDYPADDQGTRPQIFNCVYPL